MSVDNNFLDTIDIIPLNNGNFGETLNTRLETIQNNFTKIVESEYLQGAPGNNTVTKSMVLTNPAPNSPEFDDTIGVYLTSDSPSQITKGELFTSIEKAIKSKWGIELSTSQSSDQLSAIEKITNESGTEIKEKITWNQDLSGKEIILITEQISNKLILKSVIPIIHIDLRFYDKNISENPSDYAKLIDTSCSIHYDTNNGFEALSTFPTLYYDSQVGEGNLCWKINGKETGMPAQGPTGKDADPYISYLCKGEMVGENNIKIIEKWDLNNEGTYEWIPIKGKNNLPEKTQCFVLVRQENTEDSYRYDLYIIYPTWNGNESDGYFKGTNDIGVQNNWSDTQFEQCMFNLGSNGAAAGLLIPTDGGHHIFKKGENNGLLLEYSSGTDTNIFEIRESVNIKNDTNITGALNIKAKPEDLTIEDNDGNKKSLKEIIISEVKLYEEIEYNKLVEKKGNSELDPGRNYIITNYSPVLSTSQESKYNLDKLAVNENVGRFDIVVKAISPDKLSEEAYVFPHQGDTYFANCNLSAWQIMYCLENDINRFSWANNNGTGVIYLMKDEFGNIAPFDFKHIVFKDGNNNIKFLFNNNANGDDASIPTSNKSDICTGNIICDYRVDGKLVIPFINIGVRSNNNMINNSNNVQLKMNCNSNVISSSKNISLNGSFYSLGTNNSYNIGCENNIITGSSSIEMSAGGVGNRTDNCENISFGSNCKNNTLNACTNTKLSDGCNHDMIYYNTDNNLLNIKQSNTFIFNGNILANNVYQSNQ